MDLSALAVIDELVSEMQKQKVRKLEERRERKGGGTMGGTNSSPKCKGSRHGGTEGGGRRPQEGDEKVDGSLGRSSIPCFLADKFSPPPPFPPQVEVFIASASSRVVKSLDAYDLLEDVGGLPLVTLEIVDVFWAVLEDLGRCC